MNDNAGMIITSEQITRLSRVVMEKLTKPEIAEVFGIHKAEEWFIGLTDFLKLWYYATAIQQEDILEIINDHLENQSIALSKGKTIK